jgi:hypothetical protein
VACLVLSRETDLDGEDCRHLWAILDRAEGLIRWQKKLDEEMRLRMYKVIDKDRTRKATERAREALWGPRGAPADPGDAT